MRAVTGDGPIHAELGDAEVLAVAGGEVPDWCGAEVAEDRAAIVRVGVALELDDHFARSRRVALSLSGGGDGRTTNRTATRATALALFMGECPLSREHRDLNRRIMLDELAPGPVGCGRATCFGGQPKWMAAGASIQRKVETN
jgi:hypothetical protein